MDMATFKKNPVTLIGRRLKVGSVCPNFLVVSRDMKEISLSDFGRKIKIITFFLSLDTPVCDLQVKEFNKKASEISDDVVVIGISMDLPFSQAKFCESFDIDRITVLSDYKYRSFAFNYGVFVKEMGLSARGVFIVDKDNILRYSQLVPELTSPPDYTAVLDNLADVLINPGGDTGQKIAQVCTPCRVGTPPLPSDKIKSLMIARPGWQLADDQKIVREFKFKNFADAKFFADAVFAIAEEQGHHPTIVLSWGKVKVSLTTHAAGGLTDNDFIMAGIIDDAGGAE